MEERYLNDESLPQELLAWISKFYTAKNKNESKSELFRIYEEIYWEAKILGSSKKSPTTK